MIKSIKTKALAVYWFKDKLKGKRVRIQPKATAQAVMDILDLLNATTTTGELMANFRTGSFKLQQYYERGFKDDWEIRVTGNYRILFRFDGANVERIEFTGETH